MRRALLLLTLLAACGGPQATADPPEDRKVFVCKYVGKPGVDERLQTGQNPISVSINAIPDPPGPNVQPGDEFADAQGRSLVIAFDNGGPEPPPECPQPPAPTTTTSSSSTTTSTTSATTTTTCPDCAPVTNVQTTTTTTGATTTTSSVPSTTSTTSPGVTTTTTVPSVPTTTLTPVRLRGGGDGVRR